MTGVAATRCGALAPIAGQTLPDGVFRMVEAGPLWRRASGRDAQGRPLGDCLLLLPRGGAGQCMPEHRLRQELQLALHPFEDRLHLVEWNRSLGLLYISLSAERGMCLAVAEAVRRRLPQVRVVGGLLPSLRTVSRWRRWWRALARRGAHIRLPGARRRALSQPDSAPD